MEDTLPSPSQASLPVSQLTAGSDFAHYRVIGLIGEGGMGQVYRAEHRDLGRPAALKILRRELVESPEASRRFLLEARLVAAIKHPHVVEIFDFGRDSSGLAYYVMELLEGQNLQDLRASGGPFPIARICQIARQTCEALAAVHAHKVVHRDLKPDNILVVRQPGGPDAVKVVDFGVARAPVTGPQFDNGPGRTAIGVIVGTPEFMSPEQASGKPVDFRSDLYSLGVVLYWMLSDRIPFEGESFFEISTKREAGPPPPLPTHASSGEAIPASLAALTLQCLSRDPARRPTGAAELGERLGAIEHEPVSVGVAPPAAAPSSTAVRRVPAWVWGAAGASALAVAAAGWWLARPAAGDDLIVEPPPPLTQPPIEAPVLPPVHPAATRPAPEASVVPAVDRDASAPHSAVDPAASAAHHKPKHHGGAAPTRAAPASTSGQNLDLVNPYAP